jgi:PleD family two-component response regulator
MCISLDFGLSTQPPKFILTANLPNANTYRTTRNAKQHERDKRQTVMILDNTCDEGTDKNNNNGPYDSEAFHVLFCITS